MERARKTQMSFGIIFSYITIFAQCLTGILYTPIIINSLGQSEYGIYSLCISFSGYLTIFNGGMNAAYARYYVQTKTRDESKIPELNGLFVRIFLILASISLLAGFFISFKAEWIFGSKINADEYGLLKRLFVILALTTCVTVINCIYSSLIIANERFVFGKLVNLIQIILAPVCTIPLLFMGYRAEAVFVIKLILIILVTIFNALYCHIALKTEFKFTTIDKVLLKSIIVFAGAILVQNIADLLYWQVDKFVLAWTNGTIEISIYSVGATFNSYYMMIGNAVSGVFIAEINRRVALEKDKELSALFVKASRILALMVFLVMSGFIIFGKNFITRWTGLEYEKSYYVGILVMLPVTASLTMGLGQDIVRAKNVHKLQIFINAVFCICNLLISIPLAIVCGAIGSAIGTFITEIINCIIVQTIYYYKIAKLDMKSYYKEMLKISKGLILPIIYGFIIVHFGILKSNYLSIGLNVLIYSTIYITSMWLFAMNNYEKRLVFNFVNKFNGKLKE